MGSTGSRIFVPRLGIPRRWRSRVMLQLQLVSVLRRISSGLTSQTCPRNLWSKRRRNTQPSGLCVPRQHASSLGLLVISQVPHHQASHHLNQAAASKHPLLFRFIASMANDQDEKKQTVLHINASITHDSITARVATAMVEHLTHHYHRHVNEQDSMLQDPTEVLNIEELDVWSDALPKFDRDVMQKVWRARNNSQDEADVAAFRPIQQLAEQLLRADFLIITVPVWNFSIPYVLKQYIDCIVQPGLTFKNADATGPSGPFFRGRPLIIISSSGGKAPPVGEDYVVPFLSRIFAMCGFDEAHHVAIEGLATHDKQECCANAVKEANAIADLVVKNHKLRLEANDVDM